MTNQEHDKPASKGGKKPGSGKLDRDIQLRIGEGLRAMYDDVVKQGVPDRFVDLLSKLEEKGQDNKDSRDE
jgi:hypothetical protein